MNIPLTIPRVADLESFQQDPLSFLANSRSQLGDIFVLCEGAPLFSRAAECSGTIAVFGAANYQAVLSDIDLFGMPVSAAQHLMLSENLVNLNRGLHSMRGQQHSEQQRVLMRMLGERSTHASHDLVTTTLHEFVKRWSVGQELPLLSEVRRLALEVSAGYLFSKQYEEGPALAELAQTFFQLRRDTTSAFVSPDEKSLALLAELGTTLDAALRHHIRWARSETVAPTDGLLSRLACLGDSPGVSLSEDELVGHSNVLLMSTNQPIAVALTWTLLVLSQSASLRSNLRKELNQVSTTLAINELSRLPLLDQVISESLRLLTPNAMMSRITTRAGSLNGQSLPERCEILLCPFLAHREPAVFQQPDKFLPSRWQQVKPSTFEYLPFGAGGHSCVGRPLALYLLKTTLALLLRKFEFVLMGDQEIDWEIDIIFAPSNDPIIRLVEYGSSSGDAGKLCGAVADLFEL